MKISNYLKRKKLMAGLAGAFVIGLLVGTAGTYIGIKQPWKNVGITKDGGYDPVKCVKLGDYDGIKVSLQVTDEALDSEIQNYITENTTYKEKKGKVQAGDKIYAKFEGYIDGKLNEDTCGEDYISIGENEYVEGFDDAFVGAETGKEISFTISIPEGTYGDESIDGKSVNFKATVKYICGDEIVPTLNDDFVKKVSDCKTVDEFKKQIKDELMQENEEEKADTAWNQVVENCKVRTYPEDLVEDAKDEILQQYYDMADMYGMSRDELFQSWGCESEADFVKTMLPSQSKENVKERLVAEAIAKKEGVNYTDDEYNDMVQNEYQDNESDYDSKEQFEKKNRSSLKNEALVEAVKDWIVEHATFNKD